MTVTSPAGPTRRQLLKTMVSGGALAAGGGFVSACSKGGSGGADVTLKTNGDWPYGPMPTKKEQKSSASSRAYAAALSEWKQKNPGVSIKDSSLDIWDQQALTTAITGGTAPSLFPADVLSQWDTAGMRAAFKQGLSADVTEQIDKYKLLDKLEPYARDIYVHKKVDDKYYSSPWYYNVGDGIHYRLDLIRELGLKEPTPDWTWDDLRELAKGLTNAKRKGIFLQGWGMNWNVAADGMDFIAKTPAPKTSWNWQWDYMAQADRWVQLIQDERDMIYQDRSVNIDISAGDDAMLAAFFRQDVAMHLNNVEFYATPPNSDNAPCNLAKKLGKPIWDVVGWMTLPNGRDGKTGNTQGQCDTVGFSPDLDSEALDKAFSLLIFSMTTGWVAQQKAIYDDTKDPKLIYANGNMLPVFKGLFEQVPSSPEEAWGKPFMDQVHRASTTPLVPDDGWYFPAEANTGPSSTIRDDMTSRWANERGQIDIRADLKKLTNTLDKQAASFTSSTDDDVFVKDADAYYKAHSDYWQKNAPDYYDNVFKGWYEGTVLPALRG